MKMFDFHWTNLDEMWRLNFLRKSVDKIQLWLKSDKNNGYFKWQIDIFIVSRWILPKIEAFQTKGLEKIKIHTFVSKIVPLWHTVEKIVEIEHS
jgi:hypothetical protein